MKFIYQYIKPFIGIMIVGLLIKTIGTLIELALPYILSYILDICNKMLFRHSHKLF